MSLDKIFGNSKFYVETSRFEDSDEDVKIQDALATGSLKLSEVGLYAYASLCGLCLGQLFWKDSSETDRGAIQATAECNCDLDPTIVVDFLKVEPVVLHLGFQAIIEDLSGAWLATGTYDARMRTLTKHVCLLLQVDPDILEEFEESSVSSFSEAEQVTIKEIEDEKAENARKTKRRRMLMVGAAAVGGGVLLGVTGGLAAPLIAASLGALLGTEGVLLGSAAGIAVMGSVMGAAGAGLGAVKMKKRVGELEEFEFESLSEGRSLHVTLAVSGWITPKQPEFRKAWLGLNHSKEQYVLRYESDYMKEMGEAIEKMTASVAKATGRKMIQGAIINALIAGLSGPMTVLSLSNIIDNPWNVCTSRTVTVGKQLAEVLLSRQQGRRPVTLIGFSLGCRVIFYCLKELASRTGGDGIIEDVIMLGAPVPSDSESWQALASVISGTIINAYSCNDWILKFLYRTVSVQNKIAGLGPIAWSDRRMHNIDISHLISGHGDYVLKLDQLLTILGVRTKPHSSFFSCGNLKKLVQNTSSESNLQNISSESNSVVASNSNENPDQPVDMTVPLPQNKAFSLEGNNAEFTSNMAITELPSYSELVDSKNITSLTLSDSVPLIGNDSPYPSDDLPLSFVVQNSGMPKMHNAGYNNECDNQTIKIVAGSRFEENNTSQNDNSNVEQNYCLYKHIEKDLIKSDAYKRHLNGKNSIQTSDSLNVSSIEEKNCLPLAFCNSMEQAENLLFYNKHKINSVVEKDSMSVNADKITSEESTLLYSMTTLNTAAHRKTIVYSNMISNEDSHCPNVLHKPANACSQETREEDENFADDLRELVLTGSQVDECRLNDLQKPDADRNKQRTSTLRRQTTILTCDKSVKLKKRMARLYRLNSTRSLISNYDSDVSDDEKDNSLVHLKDN